MDLLQLIPRLFHNKEICTIYKMTQRKIGKYELNTKVGSGATSTVYTGSHKNTKVAVKIFNIDDMRYFLNEINVYNVLGDHKHIVKFFTAGVDLRQSSNSKAFPYIITKYYPINLSRLLKKEENGFT